jgi:hypothetical protein
MPTRIKSASLVSCVALSTANGARHTTTTVTATVDCNLHFDFTSTLKSTEVSRCIAVGGETSVGDY